MNFAHYLLFKNFNWFEFNLALKSGQFLLWKISISVYFKDNSCGSKFNGALACKTLAVGLIKKKNMFSKY